MINSRYNVAVTWIYLSPHFDDVALSCGGLVWEQAQSGDLVSIWTICAGETPPGDISPFAKTLHARWEAGQNAPLKRRAEDIASCHRLGASYRHFSLPDCIYRRDLLTGEFMYGSELSLNGPLQAGDEPLIKRLTEEIRQAIPGDITIVCPLALGNHVDHQLTRRVAEGLKCKCLYYPDFPYVLHDENWVEKLQGAGWKCQIHPISGAGLLAWQDSISAHRSQISTFWPSETEMRLAVSRYQHENQGVCLWGRLVP